MKKVKSNIQDKRINGNYEIKKNINKKKIYNSPFLFKIFS